MKDFLGQWLPKALIVFSFALHFLTVFAYTRQADALAALTLVPIWFWCAIGLIFASVGFVLFKKSLALLISTLWIFTLLLEADEAKILIHLGEERVTEQRSETDKSIRVITLNCAGIKTNHSEILKKYDPDIIFLQEKMSHHLIKRLAKDLYGEKADYRIDKGCAVIVRGKIESEVLNPYYRTQHLRARVNDSHTIDLINVHLKSAETRLDLWNFDCWQAHRQNRKARRNEMMTALHFLEQSTTFPLTPAIVAGDFNTPISDPTYRLLERDFKNVFSEIGRGWPNTYHSRFPLLRIDHIYVSEHFTSKACSAITVSDSDHRMVIADINLD